MHFPAITISKGYSVEFHSKDSPTRYEFYHGHVTIEIAKSKSLQTMVECGQNPSEYKMSTRREIKISITF